MTDKYLVALAGNPNCGKTSIFNALTGARQRVGNYSGVTVEKREGLCRVDGQELRCIDLPGTYSLTAYSIEELVARRFILDEKPDVVVNILDASNLERNLYLSVQLMELGVPLVLVFNMADVARRRGIEFDLPLLSKLLGAPIVETVGNRQEGMEALKQVMLDRAREQAGPRAPLVLRYGKEIDEEIDRISSILQERQIKEEGRSPEWLALKLIERDPAVTERLDDPVLHAELAQSHKRLESILGDSPEVTIAERRYGFISGACQEAVRLTAERRHEVSDRIDAVLTNSVLAMPIFFALMYVVFALVFTVGQAPMDWIESFFGWLGAMVSGFWPEGSESPLRSLLVDGIIGGVGGVLVFLPNILLLFLAIALLEDSGYMARAAFIMDRLMHKIGLHGKSFIPMLIGFGCTVPAIMATRTLENRRDRMTTMLIAPLMSCGARLPIYAMIIPAFFPQKWQAPALWSIYVIGIVLAVFLAKVLRSGLFRGENEPFVMELPPYRVPTLRSVLLHMWERGWMYLRKAGTLILGASIVLWAMTSYPQPDAEDLSRDYEALIAEAEATGDEERVDQLSNARQAEELSYTVAGRIGSALTPLLHPMGFDWRIGTALVGAIPAKEIFVAQMGIVFSVGEVDEGTESLRARLKATYTPLVGYCIMLFCLISTPCMATFAVTWREAGGIKWALLQSLGLTAIAWLLTVIVYQLGRLAGIGV